MYYYFAKLYDIKKFIILSAYVNFPTPAMKEIVKAIDSSIIMSSVFHHPTSNFGKKIYIKLDDISKIQYQNEVGVSFRKRKQIVAKHYGGFQFERNRKRVFNCTQLLTFLKGERQAHEMRAGQQYFDKRFLDEKKITAFLTVPTQINVPRIVRSNRCDSNAIKFAESVS